MSYAIEPGHRAEQIMRLLRRHSTLSAKAIRCIIEPTISRRGLEIALQRLIRRGSVQRHNLRVSHGRYYVYTLSEPHFSRAEIPSVRWSEVIHNDLCAIAHERILRVLPDSTILRDQQILLNAELRKMICHNEGIDEVLPDLLICMPGPTNSGPVTVGVEVERTQKSARRMLLKLNRAAARTGLDGLIYLTETDRLRQTIQAVYQGPARGHARRIAHYRDHFVLFNETSDLENVDVARLQNALGQNVSLKDWIRTLQRLPMRSRSDDAFSKLSLQANQSAPSELEHSH